VIDILTYSVPWPVWAGLAAIAVIAVLVLLSRIAGLARALQGASILGAALGALVALHRARQQGWNDREARGKQDAQDAIARAEEARRAAYDQFTSRPHRLRDSDGHRRD